MKNQHTNLKKAKCWASEDELLQHWALIPKKSLSELFQEGNSLFGSFKNFNLKDAQNSLFEYVPHIYTP